MIHHPDLAHELRGAGPFRFLRFLFKLVGFPPADLSKVFPGRGGMSRLGCLGIANLYPRVPFAFAFNASPNSLRSPSDRVSDVRNQNNAPTGL